MSRSPSPLVRYHEKRDFSQTPEPQGSARRASRKLRFVVQMHRASRLHYDFRLEIDRALASWAVPKGPTLDPREKRLAMHVEDHPFAYRTFEGIIPAGNYGAGEVIVWDEGTYVPENGDPAAAVANGELKFALFGKRLRGSFVLVKMKKKTSDGGEPWLLIKHRDEFADESWSIDAFASSVRSKTTLAKLAGDPKAPHHGAFAARRSREPAPPLPKSPMLATLVEAPFDDDAWLFEFKWDGYRAIASVDAARHLRLTSRTGTDFTPNFPELAEVPLAFGRHRVVVDGEIVVLDAHGRSSFAALQRRLDRFGRAAKAGDIATPVTFVAFDLLWLDGDDLRARPLVERKAALERILVDGHGVMFSKHVVGDGKKLFAFAQRHELEGIVAKRALSRYEERRSRDWRKIKTHRRQEFVVGGWTEPRGGRTGFGALALGLYQGDRLTFAGAVGTGFDDDALTKIARRLRPLERATSPFADKVATNSAVHWVSPKLVAEVQFAEWTRDGKARAPVFVGLRTDKEPTECVREDVRDAPQPKAGGGKRTAFATAIGGHALELSNQEKVLWPADGYTKGDLVTYYRTVAGWMLPHVRERPLTLQRFPDGVAGASFFEKHAPRGLPSWIPTVRVHSSSGRRSAIDFILCNEEATLVYLANLAAIVLHVWTSRAASLEVPDFVFFDLDPWEECTLATLARVALALRDELTRIGLRALVKTSGGSGLHVVVPIVPEYTYAVAKAFAELIATAVHEKLPELTTLERVPARRRRGSVYLDYVQVGEGKTMVAPFSVRARDRAPISMPLDWSEVEAMARKRARETEAEQTRWTIATAPALLAAGGDPWGKPHWRPQRLDRAIARLAR